MNLTPDQQEQLLKDVSTIKTALIGDPQFQQKGIVGDVADLKDWKSKMNDKYILITGAVIASWFFICIIAKVGYEWVKTKFGN